MLKPGRYKNKAGAVLEVTRRMDGWLEGYQSLGYIWKAHTPPGIFGRDLYLVTEESMRDAGYELIEEGDGDGA